MAAAGIADVAIAVSPENQSRIEEAVGSGASWGMRVHTLRAAESDPVPAVLLSSEAFLDGHPFVLQHGDGLLHHDLGALLPALEDHEGADAVLLVHPALRSRAGNGLEPRSPSHGAARDAGSRPRLAVAGAQIFGAGFIGRARDHIATPYADADVASMAGRLARASARVSVRRSRGGGALV